MKTSTPVRNLRLIAHPGITSRRETPEYVKHLLAACAHSTDVTAFTAKQLIFSQADLADCLYYIEEGCVRLSVVSKHGREAILGFLQEGSFFGESCVLGIRLRVMTAVAETATKLLRMERAFAADEMHNNPAFAQMFLTHLLARSLRVEEDLASQLLESSEKRLARILLLEARFDPGQHEMVIQRLSQEVLAEMVGTTRARISHFMTKFRNAGHIRYAGRSQTIVSESLLRMIVQD